MEKQKDIPNKVAVPIKVPYKGYAYSKLEIFAMRNWIEKNLPHLNPFDMKDKNILEYIDLFIEGGMVPFQETK